MSIKLMAYPLDFLINPEDCSLDKNIVPKKFSSKTNAEEQLSLRFVKIPTNLTYNEYMGLMLQLQGRKISNSTYILPSGLELEWYTALKYMSVNLSGRCDIKSEGEKFFQDVDNILGRNVRLINDKECFYYCYDTGYTDISQIYKSLKSNGADCIFSTENDEVVARVDNQNVKYLKINNETKYVLEVEQLINILNIGVKSETFNINSSLTNLKIRTNIEQNELKEFLKRANYKLYQGDFNTPLEGSDVILNWVYDDGYYNAVFCGKNNNQIIEKAHEVFSNLNDCAKRDLRMINDLMFTTYVYDTNYMNKEVLLNTLIEHGATEITEDDGVILADLYGMKMKYYQQNSNKSYTLEIEQISDKTKCESVLKDLDEEYGLNIQQVVYERIKERLDSENLRLESETVTEDNSIILTIEI